MHGMRSDVEYSPGNLTEGTSPIYERYKRLGDNKIGENCFPITCGKMATNPPGIEKFLTQELTA